MEDITDGDYVHAKRVCTDVEIKLGDFEIKLGQYYDLYAQSDILLLANVLENFRNICLKIYKLDPEKFLSAPRLAWQAALKLDFLTDIDMLLMVEVEMLLMVEKDIRAGICHFIYRYAEANNKHMKYYDKNKELSYIQYYDVNNSYGWPMSQRLSVNYFKWIKDTSEFNKDYIKKYNEEIDKGYFLEIS